MQEQPLRRGVWLNEPEAIVENDGRLIVTSKENSDFWRVTSYGFVHESGHALLNDFPQDTSVELTWLLNYREQFDQAGLLIWSDNENWIKAGIEFADGKPQLGAVVTRGVSDWSVAPVEAWMDKDVHLRVSRSGDAITIRSKSDGDWELVRLAPLDPERNWKVGLHLASPTRASLRVEFTSLKIGPADIALH